MTAAEAKLEFLTRYDAATSLAAPGWEDDEISNFMNIAQLKLIDNLFQTKNLNPLSNIIVTISSITPQSHDSISNGYIINLTDQVPNYLYYIRSRTKITRTNPTINSEWVPNEQLSDSTLAHKFYTSPYNKLWLKYPKAYTEQANTDEDGLTSTLIILVDYYSTANELEITSIIKPTTIDISGGTFTNLDLITHPKIVELAVEEAVKSIKIAKITTQ